MTGQYRNPKKFFALKIIGFAIIAIAAAFGLAWVVMVLWNAVLPAVAHCGILTYWQAVQLLVLCRILFGRFGGGHRGHQFGQKRQEWREKMMNMSEEERAAFKEQWRKRWRSEE